MKNAFLLLAVVGGLLSATTSKNSEETKDSLEGTWELTSYYNYDGNAVTDTILANEDNRQIKMFYNGKVMWTRYVPKDSVEWFGYGSYRTTPDRLTETLEFGSASMMKIVDTLRVFEFELMLEKDKYKQITLDENGNRVFSENYKRLD